MAAATSPIERVAAGVRVALKVTPKAARAGVTGVETDAAGRAVLKVRVNSAPEGGKANAALIKLLAKAWRLPKGALKVVAGAKAGAKPCSSKAIRTSSRRGSGPGWRSRKDEPGRRTAGRF